VRTSPKIVCDVTERRIGAESHVDLAAGVGGWCHLSHTLPNPEFETGVTDREKHIHTFFAVAFVRDDRQGRRPSARGGRCVFHPRYSEVISSFGFVAFGGSSA